VLLQALWVVCLAVGIHAGEYINVSNQSVQESFELNHSVTRKSEFRTSPLRSNIDTDEETAIGRVFLKNNTRDGYTLTITSDSLGRLEPSGASIGSHDGEVAIPYTITIEKQGVLGAGMTGKWVHESADFLAGNGQVTVLEKTGALVSEPSDLQLTIQVRLHNEDNILDMAGTYSDTLLVTYSDE